MFIYVMYIVLRYLCLYVMLFLLLTASLLIQHVNTPKIALTFIIIIIIIIITTTTKMVKQSRYRPGVAKRVPGI